MEKVEEVLERKVKEYELVVAWFDYEYQNCRDTDVVKEYEKQATELNAQIKLLRFLLDDRFAYNTPINLFNPNKMKKPTNKAERDALIKQLQAMTFNELPKRWEELGEVKGFYVDRPSEVLYVSLVHTEQANRNVFPTSDQAKASIYLAMLLQLRDVYREGWLPDWGDYESKYCVVLNKSKWEISCRYTQERPFSFQTQKRAELFFLNFEDYLDKVKPLFS